MEVKNVFIQSEHDVKVAGLYDLEHTIGRGHYAVVKLARHVFTGEKVAVKVIDKTKLDPVTSEHLFQEVMCMKLVQHPNVVRLYEVIDTGNKLYLVLELGDGGDLYDYIMKYEGGLCEPVAKRYFRQVVTAIAYCHRLHVVHRDLKPENVVFFEKLGLVKLTDFGFSNKFIPGTHLDTACGSLAYSAPEILLGDPYDAPKVDIWSLGVILYMLVCGKLPFQETNDSETVTKIMDCEYTLPSHLSPECCSLIKRLLIRDPSRRAQLDDILQAEWLAVKGNDLPIEVFSVPLVSQEHLIYEDHIEILNKMTEGKLATIEEIQSTLDRSEYNHITATYFLLAERKLKRNYIEQYKALQRESQLHQQIQAHAQLQNPDNTIRSQAPVTPTTASTITDERLRRFSMILEDEEEEEEEQDTTTMKTRSFASRLRDYAGQSAIVLGPENSLTHCDSSAVAEALLEEEEEEAEAVAHLVFVRSEIPSQSTQLDDGVTQSAAISALPHSVTGHTIIPFHVKTSNSTVDVSDSTDSEASLGSRGSSKSTSKKPRRHIVPHRPLVTVKSSPLLLKNIAEEERSGKGSTSALETNSGQGVDKYATGLDVQANEQVGRPSPRPRRLMHRSGSVEDKVGELRSGAGFSTFSAQHMRALSSGASGSSSSHRANGAGGTHSPAWTRRFQPGHGATSATGSGGGGGGNLSRPGSVTSWSAVAGMSSGLVERRRRSSLSSPMTLSMAGLSVISRHVPNSNQHHLMNSYRRSRDRRCSGPPGLLLLATNAIYAANALNSTVPVGTGQTNGLFETTGGVGVSGVACNQVIGASRSSSDMSDTEAANAMPSSEALRGKTRRKRPILSQLSASSPPTSCMATVLSLTPDVQRKRNTAAPTIAAAATASNPTTTLTASASAADKWEEELDELSKSKSTASSTRRQSGERVGQGIAARLASPNMAVSSSASSTGGDATGGSAWYKSAPALLDCAGPRYTSTDALPSPSATITGNTVLQPSASAVSAAPTAQSTVREVCAPIREEEDEMARVTGNHAAGASGRSLAREVGSDKSDAVSEDEPEVAHLRQPVHSGVNSIGIERRRRSESAGLRATSALHYHPPYASARSSFAMPVGVSIGVGGSGGGGGGGSLTGDSPATPASGQLGGVCLPVSGGGSGGHHLLNGTMPVMRGTSSLHSRPGAGSVGGGFSPTMTPLNISMSSLASSLRGSRNMLDVIRGTFELQCQAQKKAAHLQRSGTVGATDVEEMTSSVTAQQHVHRLASVRSLNQLPMSSQAIGVRHSTEDGSTIVASGGTVGGGGVLSGFGGGGGAVGGGGGGLITGGQHSVGPADVGPRRYRLHRLSMHTPYPASSFSYTAPLTGTSGPATASQLSTSPRESLLVSHHMSFPVGTLSEQDSSDQSVDQLSEAKSGGATKEASPGIKFNVPVYQRFSSKHGTNNTTPVHNPNTADSQVATDGVWSDKVVDVSTVQTRAADKQTNQSPQSTAPEPRSGELLQTGSPSIRPTCGQYSDKQRRNPGSQGNGETMSRKVSSSSNGSTGSSWIPSTKPVSGNGDVNKPIMDEDSTTFPMTGLPTQESTALVNSVNSVLVSTLVADTEDGSVKRPNDQQLISSRRSKHQRLRVSCCRMS